MERKLRSRVYVFLALIAALLLFFTFRLYTVQVKSYIGSSDSVGTYTYYTNVSAARGQILDRNGNVLVSNRASYNIIINDYVLFNSDDPNGTLLELANLCDQLGIEYADHLPITKEKPYDYTLDDLPESWQGYFKTYLASYSWDPDISAQQIIKLMKETYQIPNDWPEEDARRVLGLRYELRLRSCAALDTYILVQDVNSEDLAALMELDVPGMSVETTTIREYNTPYAAHILGRTGPMDPDEYEVLKDQGYAMNAYVGKDGLEKAFEDYLHGEDGTRVTTVTSSGEVVKVEYQEEPQAGDNIELTIDIGLQAVAENSMAAYVEQLKEEGINSKKEGQDVEGGAVVAMEVKTGQVLACASYPTFDLSRYSEDFKRMQQDKLSPMYNRAVLAAYPPGSIYKMVTSIAAVDQGEISPNLRITDEGVYTYYDSFQPKCHIYTSSGVTHGTIDMELALSFSCNYYFYEVGRLIGIDAIDSVAKSLGLGEPTGIEIPEETGLRANPETKEEEHAGTKDEDWFGADTLMAAIGQSENRFTPLQMCVYTCALANDGTRYRATLLNKVISSDYQKLLHKTEPEVESQLDISDTALETIKNGMQLCASSGTGRTYFADYDIPVACKTGTAQHGGDGSDHCSFVLYAPADDPQIAIAIYLEKGAQGGNLGTIARDLLNYYFSQEITKETYPAEGALN